MRIDPTLHRRRIQRGLWMLTQILEVGATLVIGAVRIRLVAIRGTEVELEIDAPSGVAVRFTIGAGDNVADTVAAH
jgi:hypothetical protein